MLHIPATPTTNASQSGLPSSPYLCSRQSFSLGGDRLELTMAGGRERSTGYSSSSRDGVLALSKREIVNV